MSSLNKVILIGRIGKDPESRETQNGSVCNFSLATDESYTDRNGVKQKKVEWHRVVLWKKLAEIAQNYLSKGSLVSIEGKLQTRSWEDNTGQKKYSTEIVGDKLLLLGSKQEDEQQEKSEYQQTAPPPPPPAKDDLPF